jgi:hypothetical protein
VIAALRRMGNVIGVLLCAGLLGFAVYAQFELLKNEKYQILMIKTKNR